MKYLITGFWKRITAVIIDFAVLGIVGVLIGFVLEDFLVSIGKFGMLVGLLITLIYFSFSNSSLAMGQSIGKKILKLHVVDNKGNYLSLSKSVIRSMLLYVPYFILNTNFNTTDGSKLAISLFLILSIMIIGIISLAVFNKSTHQSLHDLAVGSFVTYITKQESDTEIGKLSKIAFIIYGILALATLIYVVPNLFSDNSDNQKKHSLSQKLLQIQGVQYATTTDNTTTYNGDKENAVKSFNCELWVSELPDNLSEIKNWENVRSAIDIISKNNLEFYTYDIISIRVVRGYNIGIARKKHSHNIECSPEKWNE